MCVSWFVAPPSQYSSTKCILTGWKSPKPILVVTGILAARLHPTSWWLNPPTHLEKNAQV